MIVASLGDSAIRARLGNTTAEASRKNPPQLARDFAESESRRINDGVALEAEAFYDPNNSYSSIYDASDTADQLRFGVRQILIPRAQAYITALEAFDTTEPYEKENLRTQLEFVKVVLRFLETDLNGGDVDSVRADLEIVRQLAIEALDRLNAFIEG